MSNQPATDRVHRHGECGVELALTVDDPVLAELLDGQPPEAWPALVGRALEVGARGLVDMALGVSLRDVDERVRATLEATLDEARACSQEALEAAGRALAGQFDPRLRSSLSARTIDEFAAARDRLLGQLDPDLATSHTARFVASVTELLGPGGRVEETLRQALDPDADGSALGRLAAAVDTRFGELRDLIMREQGRADEAVRGTAKGLDFEDAVEQRLRELGRGVGAVVERVGRQPGSLGPEAVVGDFVVTMPGGGRVVVEAKNVARIGLAGRNGILDELDRALANRDADFAVCVSAQDAYTAEVGSFNVFGNRVLVVDGGDGVLLGAALRWAQSALAAAPGTAAELDAGLVLDRLERLKALAARFSSVRRTLSDMRGGIDSVRDQLDGMRCELLDQVDDLWREVQGATGGEEVSVPRVA